MQFDYQSKVGTEYATVTFKPHAVKSIALFNICDAFQRIGGEIQENVSEWKFPSFVSSIVIAQVIHNTCFVCGGLMKDSTAFKNDDLIEISNGLSMTSHIYFGAGEARLIKVRKCTVCGHSHT